MLLTFKNGKVRLKAGNDLILILISRMV